MALTKQELANVYLDYIACLNARDWLELDRFVTPDVVHNGKLLGISGYCAMLEQNFRDIPDLRFHVDLLVSDPPCIAARLLFNCAPAGKFLALNVDGRKVSFSENVFYQFKDAKIADVWSVIDKAAIEAQLDALAER